MKGRIVYPFSETEGKKRDMLRGLRLSLILGSRRVKSYKFLNREQGIRGSTLFKKKEVL